MSLTWFIVTLNAWKTYWKLRMVKNKEGSVQERNQEEQKYLVVVPVYKEPLDVILETIQSLSNQTKAGNTILSVAFESKTPEIHKKIRKIDKIFGHVFENIFYPIHPHCIAGEIPSLAILTFLTNILMFLIDWKAPQFLVPKSNERISLIRNLYHLIMSPFVMLAYSVLEFYAFHELLIRGKKVCKHGAATKNGLSVV